MTICWIIIKIHQITIKFNILHFNQFYHKILLYKVVSGGWSYSGIVSCWPSAKFYNWMSINCQKNWLFFSKKLPKMDFKKKTIFGNFLEKNVTFLAFFDIQMSICPFGQVSSHDIAVWTSVRCIFNSICTNRIPERKF